MCPAYPARTEYRVWVAVSTFIEEALAMHVVAQFRFMQEALDYVEYCKGRLPGDPVVLTGPCGYHSVYPKPILAK